jgi:hypothetical protein
MMDKINDVMRTCFPGLPHHLSLIGGACTCVSGFTTLILIRSLPTNHCLFGRECIVYESTLLTELKAHVVCRTSFVDETIEHWHPTAYFDFDQLNSPDFSF